MKISYSSNTLIALGLGRVIVGEETYKNYQREGSFSRLQEMV